MLDKVNVYKLKNYQINPYVLKGIKDLGLTIEELLLIVYLTNEKDYLDLLDIEEKTSLSEEEVLASYSTLLAKGLIEVKMEKIDGKINESISLDNLYNKLVFAEKEKPVTESSDIYECFEKEFAKTLSPIEYEIINKWLEDGISEETIKKALKEAVLNGVTSLRYIDKIIHEWSKKEMTDTKNEELFDYDWINASDE